MTTTIKTATTMTKAMMTTTTTKMTTTTKKKKVNLCFLSLSFDGNQNLQQAYKGWIVHFWPPLASGDGDLGGQSNGQTASNLLRCCKNVRPTKQGPISRNFSMRKNYTTHSNRTVTELLSSMTSRWISFRSILIWERPVWGQVFFVHTSTQIRTQDSWD